MVAVVNTAVPSLPVSRRHIRFIDVYGRTRARLCVVGVACAGVVAIIGGPVAESPPAPVAATPPAALTGMITIDPGNTIGSVHGPCHVQVMAHSESGMVCSSRPPAIAVPDNDEAICATNPRDCAAPQQRP